MHNVLVSPTINVGSADPVYLQFRRWLQVEDGFWDDAEVQVNGELVWTQYSSPAQDGADQHHDDAHWAFRSYDITDLVGPTGDVEVQWHLISDAGLTRGGWNIDDVRVITPNGDIIDPGDDDDATEPGDDDDATEPGDDDDSTAQQDDDDAVDDDDDDDAADDDDDDAAETPYQGGSSSFAAAGSACSCTTANSSSGAGVLGLLLLLGFRRRRG